MFFETGVGGGVGGGGWGGGGAVNLHCFIIFVPPMYSSM